MPTEGEGSPTPRLRFRSATSTAGSLWSAAQTARLRRRLRACGYRCGGRAGPVLACFH